MRPIPPLLPIEALPPEVLVVAPHPDDEVLGCGGLMRAQVLRGGQARVLVVTDGGGGLEGHARQELTSAREAECRAAANVLGVEHVQFLGLRDHELAQQHRLVEILREALEADPAGLVLLPSPLDPHPDHRAAALACAAALAQAGTRRVGFYGISRQVPANVLIDVTQVASDKDDALTAFGTQAAGGDLVSKAQSFDRAWTRDVDRPDVQRCEGFVLMDAHEASAWVQRAAAAWKPYHPGGLESADAPTMTVTAVISTWNKAADVCANLDGLRAQTRPFDAVVVVDNCSSDDTAERILRDYPEVRLVVMPNSAYGACETFNIGFACARTDLIAILDDDVVLTPGWLEGALGRLEREPATTAVISTKIVEPNMPESYLTSTALNSERYMSTFRGCASLARRKAIEECGGYDERLFIYGNERDLTCRLLNRGYRVLQFPEAQAFHKTPFGLQMGKRSLYYHARNAWIGMFKYAPLGSLLKMPWLVLTKVVLRGEKKEIEGEVTDATGTIGLGRSLRETPGAWWVLVRAAWSVFCNIPYCLKHREPVRSDDFDLPIS
tara:strand:- start:3680 stop:5341 length:1662 start_codon:yes stop_codon:yes gene_type:complete